MARAGKTEFAAETHEMGSRLVAPRGVAVHLAASHLCTRMRGVEEDSHTVTTFWRGAFEDAELRREVLDEVRVR